ncbi:hypothetical protein SBF1_6560001 [Candidatus Desulfosporosinus infrequens]|uniref:DNA methylase adenine-specific domain-containing protein n=1 Tax=Candidatus Desulfosporosinus infrequens TaxID=2043169 RepID=A0A2U3LNB5_9FIRM|nr:hypothetical protein SBF1_6560001 [Candidatus Desulfosporosinus infrequens]
MARLLAPTPNDKICDFACGTAGFLVFSAEYIRENFERLFYRDSIAGGKGYYQEEGKQVQMLPEGDVIKIRPDVYSSS